MISQYDYERWGHFWGFTSQSLRKLFSFVDEDDICIEQFGNAKVATYFLYGLACEEMCKEDFEVNDIRYPIIITARVKKV